MLRSKNKNKSKKGAHQSKQGINIFDRTRTYTEEFFSMFWVLNQFHFK